MEVEVINNNKKEEKTGTGTEDREREQKQEKNEDSLVLHRLSATKEADEALGRIIDRVNDGFGGGRVSRIQVLSWLLIRQQDTISEAMIQEIRVEFFDEVAMLEAILRQAKATGKISPDFRSLLQKQIGLDDQSKRKGKKPID